MLPVPERIEILVELGAARADRPVATTVFSTGKGGGTTPSPPSPVPYVLGVASCARAAASRATGMRNGEQDT